MLTNLLLLQSRRKNIARACKLSCDIPVNYWEVEIGSKCFIAVKQKCAQSSDGRFYPCFLEIFFGLHSHQPLFTTTPRAKSHPVPMQQCSSANEAYPAGSFRLQRHHQGKGLFVSSEGIPHHTSGSAQSSTTSYRLPFFYHSPSG